MTFKRRPTSYRTNGNLSPRLSFDPLVVEMLGARRVRITFTNETVVRRVSRVSINTRPTPLGLALASAMHSRLGAVTAAVAFDGDSQTLLGPGEHVVLDYVQTPPVGNQRRDYFLEVRGRRVNLGGSAAREARTDDREANPFAPTVPLSFALRQAEPTPFSNSTRIRFDLPKPARVHLEVFDLQGRRVASLADEFLAPGQHAREWSGLTAAGGRAAHGVYLYRLRAGEHVDQRKLVLTP